MDKEIKSRKKRKKNSKRMVWKKEINGRTSHMDSQNCVNIN
jgi:hypothetical protein